MKSDIDQSLRNIFYTRFGVTITDDNRKEHIFGKLRFSPYDALYLIKYIEETFSVQIGEQFFKDDRFSTYEKIENIVEELIKNKDVA